MIKKVILHYDDFLKVTYIYLLYTDIYMAKKSYVYHIHTNCIKIFGRKRKEKEIIDCYKNNADRLIYLLHKYFKLNEKTVYDILRKIK